MEINSSLNKLYTNLNEFRRKFYLNKVLRGSLLLLVFFSAFFTISVLSEGFFNFPPSVKTVLFYSLFLLSFSISAYYIFYPLLKMLHVSKPISNEQAANMIGKHFSSIDDKLLNLLQLSKTKVEQNDLLIAAIIQKSESLSVIPFKTAINLKPNFKLLRYLTFPLLLIFAALIYNPSLLELGTFRFVNYNKEFLPPAPFSINLSSFSNEMLIGDDFEISSKITGKEFPSELFFYVRKENQSVYEPFSMTKDKNSSFAYTYKNVKQSFFFYVGNEEVKSQEVFIKVYKKPEIDNFRIFIQYPAYTKKGVDTLPQNVGDFVAIKGSKVNWVFSIKGSVDKATFVFDSTEKIIVPEKDFGLAHLSKSFMKETQYFINLYSKHSTKKEEPVIYHGVIEQDRFPSILLRQPIQDFSIGNDMILPIEAEISDDFGFSGAKIFYKYTKSTYHQEKLTGEYFSRKINISSKNFQSIVEEIDLVNLGVEEGDEIEFYIKVWDNDQISGFKSAKSISLKAYFPSVKEVFDQVDSSQTDIQDKLEQLTKDSEKINEKIEKIQQNLLTKKKLSFEDKKEISNLMQQKKELNNEIENISKQLEQTKEQLDENNLITPETKKKYDDLQKLLEEMKDPKYEKLMKQLEKKLDKMNNDQINKQLDQMKFDEEQLKKDLERAEELLKQLKVQQKSEELLEKLDNIKNRQDLLKEQSEKEKLSKEQKENLSKKQDMLKKEMEDVKKELEKLEKMKSETQTPDKKEMDELKKMAENIQKEMKNSSESLSEGKNKPAKSSQSKSSEQLQKMMDKLSSMQSQSMSNQSEQNLGDLRTITENLLLLSFKQEILNDETKFLKYNDPKIKPVTQKQKQITDDMVMLSDSLNALAQKVFQIQKFVTEELQKINLNLDKSLENLDSRNIYRTGTHQKFAMTSMNNLANMLGDVMNQMMQQMMQSKKKGGMCQKPGGRKPNLSQLGKQQQKLNQQMQKMMKDGKMGDKGLAKKLAEQQKKIRQSLKDAQNKMKAGKKPGNALFDKIMKDMKDTENDLLNKQLSHETLTRQQKIINRLLDATKSLRKRKQDKKRESNVGLDIFKHTPGELSKDEKLKMLYKLEMLKSIDLEYSKDYQKMIENYYLLLEI